MSGNEIDYSQARRLESLLKRHMSQKATGVYELLRAMCMKKNCGQISTLPFTNPEKLVEIVKLIYKDDEVVRFTIRVLILRPIFISLKLLDREGELVDLLFRNPSKFKLFMINKLRETR